MHSKVPNVFENVGSIYKVSELRNTLGLVSKISWKTHREHLLSN